MRVLLLVVLATMHLASVSRALSCSSLLSGSANLIVDLTSLRACLRALPVNQTFNSEVAETAILSAQLHALAPYVPSTYSAILNLRNLLQLNEFDFLSNVSRAFASATDLHFTMRGPPFYDRVYVLRLLSFGSQSYVDPATNQTAQQLYISNTVTSSNYNTLLSLWQASGTSANLPSLASITATLNKAVATVNGLPALVWARQAARASGLKSDGVNFNYALQSNFFARLLNEYDVNRDVDTIVFSDGTAFTAPAMAYVSASSAISKSYRCDLPSTAAGSVHARREENFAPQQAPQTYFGSTQLPQMIGVGRVGAQDPAMREVVELIFGPSPSSAPSTSSVSVGSVTGFGSASIETTASGKKIALLRINSFLPSGDLNTAANNIYAMIRNLQTQSLGITNELAIDVSENGGGYVVLGDLLLKLLDSTYNEAFIAQGSSYLIADANQKNSLWYSAYIRSSVFSGPFKQFPYNDLNASFIYDAFRIKPYYYGQGTNPWWWQASATNYYTSNFQYFLGTSVAASTVNPFTRVRIISDGVCGSTCCHFASRLSTWGMVGTKVESIGFGSFIGDTNIPISDFCGGSVLTTSCVLSTAGLSTHPFMTMNTLREDIDFGFVDMAILKTNASTVHMQYDTPMLATKQISDWTALTNQQRRLDLAYSDVSSARMAAGVLLSMVISVVVGVVVA